MSEFIASAEIAIIPNTKGFRAKLVEDLKEATKVPAKVKVRPDTTGFVKELRAQLRVMKMPTAFVPVRPDMKGFRVALQAGVDKSSKGVVATVGTTAGPARQTTGGGGGGRAARTAATELAAAQEASSFARKRISKDFDEQERRAQSLSRELLALKAAQTAETAAIREGNAELAREAALLRQSAGAAVEKRRATIARAAERADAPAARVRAAEAAAAAELKAQQNLGKAMAADTEKRLAAQLAAQERLGAAMAKDVDNQIKAEATKRKKAFNDRIAEIKRLQAQALKSPGVVSAQALVDKDVALQARLNKLREAGLDIDASAIGQTTALGAARAKRNAAESISVALERARKEAIRAGLAVTAEAIVLEQRLAAATLEAAIADEAAAQAEVKQSKARAFGARGATAQLATFAGLRGAVLSANSAFIAGTVAAIAFGKAVQSAAGFESQMNVFRVVSGATADQMERVSARAKQLGADISLPGVSAGQAAEVIAQLSKAGLTVEDSLGGVRGVLQLSTAASIEQAQAVELVASALNAFGLAGTEAVHIADLLTNSANLAQGSIEDIAIALQQSSSVARQFGVSADDTVSLLTLLAKAGLRGSDAGTSLRVAFTRLVAPTEEAAKVLKALNVQVLDAEGNLRPEVFADIAEAQKDLTRAQQNANAKIIFGVDALRAYSVISRAGLTGIEAMRSGLDQQGSAAELAGARMVGLTGKVEALKNQIETLGLSLGESLIPALTETAKLFTRIAKAAELATKGLGKFREEAAKKIPGDGFLDDLLSGSLPKQVESFLKTSEKVGAFASGDFRTPETVISDAAKEDIATAQKGVSDILNTLRLAGDTTSDFNLHTALTDLDKLAAGLEGTEMGAKLAAAIRDVRKQLADEKVQIPFAFPPVELPDILGPMGKAVSGLAREQEKLFVVGKPQGLLDPGNLDVLNRKVVRVGEELATLRSIVISVGKGKFAVIPSIIDGARVTEKAARRHYEETGEHLGIFTGAAVAKAYAKSLSDHQDELHASTTGVFRPLPKTAAEAFAAGIPFEDVFGLGALFMGRFADGVKSNAVVVTTTVTDIVTQLMNQLLGLADQMNVQILAKSREGQIAVQRDIIERNKRIIAIETKRLQKLTPKDPGYATATERVRKARAAQVAAVSTIEGIEAEAAAETQKRKDDAQKARDKADQNLLDALAPATRRLDTRALRAEGTETPIDDIGVARDQIENNKKMIRAILKSFKDRKQAQELVSDLKDDNIRLNQQITADLEAMFKSGRQAFEVKLGAAQAEENIELQIALTRGRIAKLERLIRESKGEGEKLKAYNEELKQRNRELEGLQDTKLDARKEFAQSVFDLTGNKNPLLRAIAASLKVARKAVTDAKKGTVAWFKARTKVNDLLDERKELLKDTEDKAKEGTTAFDLLKQYTEVFNESAGNLIGPDQPFVNAADFTSDISKFLVKKPSSGTNIPPRAPGGKTKLELNDDRLTRSLDRLSGVMERAAGKVGDGRNRATGSQINPVTTNIARNDLRWSRQAREEVQG